MKPEKELHQHVERSKRIVPPADMTYLMVENRPELGRAEHTGDSGRRHPTTEGSSRPGQYRTLISAWICASVLDRSADRITCHSRHLFRAMTKDPKSHMAVIVTITESRSEEAGRYVGAAADSSPNGCAMRTTVGEVHETPAAACVIGADTVCAPKLISIENGITNFTDAANHTQNRIFA
jgi:hypothetical protein